MKKTQRAEEGYALQSSNDNYMSHVKNMQNFDKVIAVCTGLGGNYNPGKQNLSVVSLMATSAGAHSALLAMGAAKTNFYDATNHREVAFEDVNKLAARIVSELKSSGVLVQKVHDARYIQRKLTGFRASRDPVDTGAMDNGASVKKSIARGLDYTTLADNFRALLQTLRTEPLYQPVADDLKLPALEAKLATLVAANADVVRCAVELKNARSQRDEVLYLQSGSVYEQFHAAKQRLKATFGSGSPQFKGMTGVVFIKPAIM